MCVKAMDIPTQSVVPSVAVSGTITAVGPLWDLTLVKQLSDNILQEKYVPNLEVAKLLPEETETFLSQNIAIGCEAFENQG